jgi:hypothetical protein
MPAKHDASCFADLFRSFKHYTSDDLQFDLSAARDRLALRDPVEQERVKRALLPYGTRSVRFAGFAIIDLSTRDDSELQMLATRKSDHAFDVDVLCVEAFAGLCDAIYSDLERYRR